MTNNVALTCYSRSDRVVTINQNLLGTTTTYPFGAANSDFRAHIEYTCIVSEFGLLQRFGPAASVDFQMGEDGE